MSDNQPVINYLKDYQPPAFDIDSVELIFDLFEDHATVQSIMQCQRSDRFSDKQPLILNGKELELISIMLNDQPLTSDRFMVQGETLTISEIPDQFQLEINTRIEPQNNTALEGLYKSSRMFCTQCEAEGFRKITYYPDRPDVMTRFSTKIIADQVHYPVLLSNGNPVEKGTLDNNRHWARWEDPHKKPAYLFALVAGDLVALEDQFITQSGRDVSLKIFVEKENINKCDHAMKSLKQCMKWDEDVFGREYDLDIFMIVAVADFNMGAMENKGLNIFNSSYVLAKPETATDSDFEKIQGVIAHEYFHNWTGNRITCRDWFQLSLKEGLTIFRDQQFTADMTSRTVKRIQDVNLLRSTQFIEDSGPMAHAVRPDSYIEINNFYTATIYYKGAELIRMMVTLLGETAFHQAMDLYFERHDGEAVTTEDFVKCMEDGSGIDLTQFRLWYTQAGTPVVKAETRYDKTNRTLELNLSQKCPPTPGQLKKQPFHIPVKVGLLTPDGNEIPPVSDMSGVRFAGNTAILNLKEEKQTFRFDQVPDQPIVSLFREFSAPVNVQFPQSDTDLIFLIANDTDDFNRWQASQHLLTQKILSLAQTTATGDLSGAQVRLQANQTLSQLIDSFQWVLANQGMDKAFMARLLALPSETVLSERMEVIDIDSLHIARQCAKSAMAEQLKETLLETYHTNHQPHGYRSDAEAIGQRAIKNLCLDYLMALDSSKIQEICLKQYGTARNMTDEINALTFLANTETAERQKAIDTFYHKWKNDSLVLDMWFALQSASPLTDIEAIKTLTRNPSFDSKNPNKLRSVIGSFCSANLTQFHLMDGSGYKFLADQIEILNKQNPQIAARLLSPLIRWKRFDKNRSELMKNQLERLARVPGLSNDVFEIITKSLA